MYNYTIVTAYIEIPKKKFPSHIYYRWITNYMLLIKATPLIIYTNSQQIKQIILNLRKDYLDTTIIIDVSIQDLYCYKYIDYFNKDFERDLERYHDPLLYLIWNNKTAFIYDAYKKNLFDSIFYLWTDIGMIRDEITYNTLEKIFLSSDINKIDKNTIHLLEVEKFNLSELNYTFDEPYKFKENRCGGGVILCSKHNIELWFNKYYEMLEKFIKYDIFAGKDQNILNNLYIKNKNLIKLVEPNNTPFDKWFYMLYFISI